METQELITIIHAAQVSGKSIQTIRRMIKQKKIRVRKQKTPQGFNYLIIKDSLSEFMEDSRSKAFFMENSPIEGTINTPPVTTTQVPQAATQSEIHAGSNQTETANSETVLEASPRVHRTITVDEIDEFKKEVGKFNSTIQQLIEENSRDKSNLFELIKTFQDRVIILENQIKQLEAPKSSWWKVWK